LFAITTKKGRVGVGNRVVTAAGDIRNEIGKKKFTADSSRLNTDGAYWE
jgi:hypothetical protein